MASVPPARTLFPTGDPGFEHLVEGSLAALSFFGGVEAAESVAELEAESQLPDSESPQGTGAWEPGSRRGATRFGEVENGAPVSPPRFGGLHGWRTVGSGR